MNLFIDYETYYDDDYSLSKMNRTLYLNDPRFKVHGASVALDNDDCFWVTGTDMQAFFNDVSPYLTGMWCHNGLFDHGITAKFYMPQRRLGIPLGDTMSMANIALLRRFPGQRMSLAKLAEFYFPDDERFHKWLGVLENFKGVYNLNPQQEKTMAGYANQDNFVLYHLRLKLLQENVPWNTVLQDIDLTLAMGCYPALVMDTDLASRVHAREVAQKEEAVVKLGVDRAALRSNDKFAELLMENGCTPPTKLNAKGEETYAFAQKDVDFMALAYHENPTIQALYELRIGEKSAQVMNRSYAFSQLPSPVPVPLKVNAAHTGRHGGDEYNLQNLKRGSDLRRCIRAANGYKLVVGDAKQIELRVNAWFCDEETLITAFRNNIDVYCELGTVIYGRTITKADESERFNAKTGELGCQYGAGENRLASEFQTKVKIQTEDGREIYMPKDQALALGKMIKKAYRSKRTRIVKMWAWLNDVAIHAMAGLIPPVERKGVKFEFGKAVLPSGRTLWYPNLYVNDSGEWVYTFVDLKHGRPIVYEKRLYGGAFLENLIQAMSYDIFMYQMRLAQRYVSPLRMAVHDEGVFMVPCAKVPEALDVLGAIYQSAPDWFGTTVPIMGEFGVGDTYYECK